MQTVKVLAEVLLQAEDGLVLIVRRGQTDERRPSQWDVPGGHVDDGEDLLEAAVRETKEETGIEVSKNDLRLDYAYTKSWDTSNSCTWLFFTAKTPKKEPTLSAEHSEYRWASLDEAIDLIEYDLQKTALSYIRDNHLLD